MRSSGSLRGSAGSIGRCVCASRTSFVLWCFEVQGLNLMISHGRSCCFALSYFLQICEEKTGITLLKRLSHGGIDASAAFFDVSTTPLCCSAVVGGQPFTLAFAFACSSSHQRPPLWSVTLVFVLQAPVTFATLETMPCEGWPWLRQGNCVSRNCTV